MIASTRTRSRARSPRARRLPSRPKSRSPPRPPWLRPSRYSKPHPRPRLPRRNRPRSWEPPTPSAPRGEPQFGGRPDRDRPDYRPSFRPDRREERGSEPRQEGRDPRRDQAPREPRPQFDQRPRREPGFAADRVAPEAKAPTGGFFGWLKGLFGRSKPAVEAPAGRDSGGEPFGDEHRHRRRHRGGRGHGGGNPQGFLGERSPQGSEYENRGGDRHGGPRRRRHRGGQGRDRGGDPRSEGQQGGGAI